MHLLGLTEYSLLAIIEELPIADIKSIRQTCKQLRDLTRLRSVWLRLCNSRVIRRNLPFPKEPIEGLDATELERRTCHALRLQAAWSDDKPHPRPVTFKAAPVNALVDVKFLVREGNRWLIVLSEGIWPVIECWDLATGEDGQQARRVGEWPCSGGLISNVVVNSDPLSLAFLAFSISRNGVSAVRVMSVIRPLETDPGVIFEDVKVIYTSHKPVALEGELLVLSNERSEIQVLNWRTGKLGILQGDEWDEEDSSSHRCLQVFFAHECILVARARSLDLFPMVELRSPDKGMAPVRPVASHSFGWIDGISIAFSSEPNDYHYSPITILLRAESGDPWASEIHTINRYDLIPNFEYQCGSLQPNERSLQPSLPYLFPPQVSSSIPSQRGFLRCPLIALGHAGSALWVHPRVYTRSHPSNPLDQEVASVQMLCCTVFRGPLSDTDPYAKDLRTFETLTMSNGVTMIRNKILWDSKNSIWTTITYDEVHGLVALGSHDGQVTVLHLAERGKRNNI